VHDEAGVDAEKPPVRSDDVMGVGMATESRVGLVQRHVGVVLQDVRGGESGDAGTDDGDLPAAHVLPARASSAEVAGSNQERHRCRSVLDTFLPVHQYVVEASEPPPSRIERCTADPAWESTSADSGHGYLGLLWSDGGSPSVRKDIA
jgi:hypothetical protein